ncbi:MAG: hypothetical protein IT370_16245 [Deltaproteobacteria bacterium]|nr:hypothetical protein [Deltaproteobacteria bacterium]
MRRLLLGMLLLASVSGCGGDSGSSQADPKAPFPRYTANTRSTWTRSLPDGTKKSYESRLIGQVTVNGETFEKFQAGDPPSTPGGSGGELVGHIVDADTVVVVSVAFRTTSASILGVPEYVSATADAPVKLEIEPPLGVAQPFSVSGKTVLGSPSAAPLQGTLTGSYTLAEKGVAIASPLGMVTGCNHYTVAASVPFLFGSTMAVSGEAWYSPQLGVVKASLSSPLSGLSVGMAATGDGFDLGDGWASVTAAGTRGAGATTGAFQLSSRDFAGEFDADKNTHAKMYLEVRWADESKALTDTKPFVQPVFGTVFGQFPSTLVLSPVSLLFPEDNGKGYKHWVGFVDQAAKNESQNGIAYTITANYDPSFSPIRLAGRIVYKRIAQP